MNDRDFIADMRDRCNAQLGSTPLPGPTPPPTQTPEVPPGVVVMTMPNPGASTFLDFQAGVPYAFIVPKPTAPGRIQTGEGKGKPAFHVDMALSKTPGDYAYCKTEESSVTSERGGKGYPCGASNTPCGISWTPDPNGSFERCRVDADQWYVTCTFAESGSQSFEYIPA